MNWYLLPSKMQWHFLIILQKWETGMTLRMGPIGTLNYHVTTIVIIDFFQFFIQPQMQKFSIFQLTKRIYTLLMVLMNYF